jgi:curved DNA-binding protein CbpA
MANSRMGENNNNIPLPDGISYMYSDFAKNYYELLSVSINSSRAEITSAFRKLSVQCHPDKTKSISDKEQLKLSERMWNDANNAKEILTNPETRREYDDFLARNEYLHPKASLEREIPQGNTMGNPPENARENTTGVPASYLNTISSAYATAEAQIELELHKIGDNMIESILVSSKGQTQEKIIGELDRKFREIIRNEIRKNDIIYDDISGIREQDLSISPISLFVDRLDSFKQENSDMFFSNSNKNILQTLNDVKSTVIGAFNLSLEESKDRLGHIQDDTEFRDKTKIDIVTSVRNKDHVESLSLSEIYNNPNLNFTAIKEVRIFNLKENNVSGRVAVKPDTILGNDTAKLFLDRLVSLIERERKHKIKIETSQTSDLEKSIKSLENTQRKIAHLLKDPINELNTFIYKKESEIQKISSLLEAASSEKQTKRMIEKIEKKHEKKSGRGRDL